MVVLRLLEVGTGGAMATIAVLITEELVVVMSLGRWYEGAATESASCPTPT